MTWKSTALAGAGLIATSWFGVQQPPLPASDAAAPTAAAPLPAPESDIAREAARLHARIGPASDGTYAAPSRDPFRFAARPVVPPAARAVSAAPPAALPPSLPIAPVVLQPEVTLAGIAGDGEGEAMTRTAILSTMSGVQLVREGEVVEGSIYRVRTIEEEAVELEGTDGSSRRLTFLLPPSVR